MNAPVMQIAQQLQSAARLLQAGDLVRARALLEQVLALQPGLPDAYWLLGGVLMRGGDYARAERAVMTAIQLAPGNPSAHALLGEILACQGRMDEAERALRQTLKFAPTHPQAVSLLLRVLVAQNRHADALQFIDAQPAALQTLPDVVLARAQALFGLRRIPEAIGAFRSAVNAAPNDGRAALGLASALGANQEPEATEAAARQALAKGADAAEAHFLLARALLAQGRHEESDTELRTVIRVRPDHVMAHTNLAELLWMRTGDADLAAADLDKALLEFPGNVELRTFKSKLLQWAGRPSAGLSVIEEALQRDPGNPALHLAAAQTALRCDVAASLRHARLAIADGADNPVFVSALGNALLANGHAEEALQAAERLLQRDPHDGHAIALRASAWRMLGDPRYAALYDYAHFVRPATIDTPPGWSSLADYLRDLAAALHKRHVMQAHPIGQTLRTGTQVDLDLEREQDPAIRAFAQAIDGPIRRYMQAIGPGNDVLRSRNADDYKITGIWSVRLRANGHHVNHYHPEGWLSSACYIELPEALGAKDHEGWIKFGESGIPTQPPLEAEHFVKPEPGLLVLFPSWMWHGTVPFAAGERDRRLTIAFDVVPV